MKKRAFAHSWVDKIGVLFFLEAGDEGQGGRHSDGVAAVAMANGGHHNAAAGIAAVVATIAHCWMVGHYLLTLSPNSWS